MSLNQKIPEDLKEAIKTRDALRTSCLRMLKTAMKNAQVEKGRELEDEEIRSLISSSVKKGAEAAQEFRRGGREDLAEKEEKEIRILYEYLPEQLTPEEVEATLRGIIAELSASGPKDLGKVMKVAMTRMAGRGPGQRGE